MATDLEQLNVAVGAETSGFNNKMAAITAPGGPIMKIATVATAAAGIATAAIAGVATKGLSAFSDFERGMSEVFTLLPDASEEAMDAMSNDVRDFAQATGQTTEEVTGALYQALSAGVPEDNVFDFLEIANELAQGGLTDVETAVDGLTSVVNAYGAENLSAAEAADIFMATIADGKTTADELAPVISRITPIASELGVGFEEVAASMALLTSKGVPTAEAATQVRAMLNELGKSGTDVSKKFQELSGKSFKEFQEEGGTVGEALVMLQEEADKNNKSLGDMFGSIEAGGAALLLATDGGAQYAEALDNTANASGMAEEAYESTQATLDATTRRIKSQFSEVFLIIGEQLAPAFGTILAAVEKSMPAVQAIVEEVFGAIGTVVEFVINTLIPNLRAGFQGTHEDSNLFTAIAGIIGAAFEVIREAFELGVALWETRLKPVWERMEPLVTGIFGAVATLIETALNNIAGFFDIFAALLEGDFAGAWETYKGMVENTINALWDAVKSIFEGAFGSLEVSWEQFSGRFQAAIDLFKGAVEGIFTGMKNAVQGIVDSLFEAIETGWNTLKTNSEATINAFKTTVTNTFNTLFSAIETAWNTFKTTLETGFTAFKTASTSIFTALKSATETIFSNLFTAVGNSWNTFMGTVTGIVDNLVGGVTGAFDGMVSAATGAWNTLQSNIAGIVGDIASSIRDLFDNAIEHVTGLLSGIADAVRGPINEAIGMVNSFIDRFNSFEINIPSVEIPGITMTNPFTGNEMASVGPWTVGGQTVGMPDVSRIPALAEGGIVTKPTFAMIGEGGESEAVIPLSKLGNIAGGNQTIIVELDGRQITKTVVEGMPNMLRTKGITRY